MTNKLTPEQARRVNAIRQGRRPAGLSDAEWRRVQADPVAAVTR